ncbi:MAG TPA: helix-turn-helix domain-containing protein [Baekduia sp.]|nr:helix-turn-helix domain-containing protein [Baekduia sp.]
MDLPSSLAADLRPALPHVAEEIIAVIGREVPDYRRPLRGPFGRALRLGVTSALARFIDSIENPAAADAGDVRETYLGLGRLEFQTGRSIDALQSAYRIGARVAWEHFVKAAAAYPPEVLFSLAAEIFSYIDRISSESVEGYVAEQSIADAHRSRRRAAVARLLAHGAQSEDELRVVAKEALWRLPREIAALVTAGEDSDRLAGRLGADTVAMSEGGLIFAFVPDPDGPGRRGQIEAAVEAEQSAIGPTVAPEFAHRSLARARAAHDLIQNGTIAGEDAIVAAEEHLVTLMLTGDAALAAELTARALAPLSELKQGPRERLTETLRVWLDSPGQIRRIAETLDVHPQTVRYRVGQLRELFGERLDDPDARFELQLAVRAAG